MSAARHASSTPCGRRRSFPKPEELYTDVYYNEVPKFIRGVDIESSKISA
jgi:hypothetical protein